MRDTIDLQHTSRNAINWSGTYEGTVPAADGPGIRTTLTLSDELTYRLRTSYIGEAAGPVERTGSFEWLPSGGSIRLLDLDGQSQPTYYKVEEGRLRQLVLEGDLITGELADLYLLTKVE